MRIAVIACEVLFRECALAAAHSTATVDLVMLPQGLHNTPADLRARVQAEVDRLDAGPAYAHHRVNDGVECPRYDAILLAYALCSNGVVGVTAGRTPLVIPRGHDCITLLLGSREAYQQYFDTHRGIYGWVERTLQPGRERHDSTRAHYVETYGEDNADYLMEMEQGWFKEYAWATYINWDLPTAARDRAFTQDAADFLGWQYDEVRGDTRLMFDFLDGQWDDARFLTVPSGACIEPSHDTDILKACAGCACHGAAQLDDQGAGICMNR
jgi:hypothetical protein